ncbi:MAG: energy-coupling factor transporter ATPase [Sphaerochaetaceae bacterium]|nr:energy-coupling factor transporter ATPase [Sphaerochaetaceae bacterium]
MSLIRVRDLSFRYDENTRSLEKISFDIEEGDYVTIVGRNGSGKSTLARLLVGLETPDEGTIEIDGKILSDDNLPEIRKRIGIVFQNPDNQFIGATVRDDIAFGLENRCFEPDVMKRKIEKYSRKVGLSQLLDKEPEALSGGQKQRVAIAGILAMHPDIIVFDEATSMLDPRGRETIKDIIDSLHQDRKLTIISITHDIEEVMNSDDCIVLYDGRVFDHGRPEKVFADADRVRSIGLDVSFIGKVKEAFRKYGIVLKSDTEDEMVGELWQYALRR